MTGRWTTRGDRPGDHDTDCICPACWTRLELVQPDANDRGGYAGWCGAHGDVIDLTGCEPCGPTWSPDGAA